MDILLFDIDGTLTRSYGAGRRAFDKVFARLYQLKEASEGLEFAGKTDPLIIREIFRKCLDADPTENEMTRVKKAYLAVIENDVRTTAPYKAIDGILELLNILAKLPHILLGLATGNFRESAFLKLESAGLRKFFTFGGFGSDSAIRAELTRVGIDRGKKLIPAGRTFEKAYVIGDTPQDVDAGKKSGAVTIAMMTGTTRQEDFMKHKPDHILSGYHPAQPFLQIIEEALCRKNHPASSY